MINGKKSLLIALIVPILSLLLLVGYKHYIISSGKKVILPIKGYDPRDLLSGHYLIYTVDYGVKDICGEKTFPLKKTSYICIEPKKFSYDRPNDCKVFIQGTCYRGRFKAGIERYYVPEKKATAVERTVQKNDASIVVSVLENGKAQVKSLLINGTVWK